MRVMGAVTGRGPPPLLPSGGFPAGLRRATTSTECKGVAPRRRGALPTPHGNAATAPGPPRRRPTDTHVSQEQRDAARDGTYDLLFCGHTLNRPRRNCPSCEARTDLHDVESGMHVTSTRHFHGGAGATNRAWSPPNRHDVMTGDNALEAGQRLDWLEAVRRVTGVDPRELKPHDVDRNRRRSRAIEHAGSSGVAPWRAAPTERRPTAPAGRRSRTSAGCATPTPALGSGTDAWAGPPHHWSSSPGGAGPRSGRTARTAASPAVCWARLPATRGAQGKKPRGRTTSAALIAGALTESGDALASASRATMAASMRRCEAEPGAPDDRDDDNDDNDGDGEPAWGGGRVAALVPGPGARERQGVDGQGNPGTDATQTSPPDSAPAAGGEQEAAATEAHGSAQARWQSPGEPRAGRLGLVGVGLVECQRVAGQLLGRRMVGPKREGRRRLRMMRGPDGIGASTDRGPGATAATAVPTGCARSPRTPRRHSAANLAQGEDEACQRRRGGPRG